MSKKLIALLMAAMMLLSVAAACGNDAPEETPTKPVETPTTPAETPTTPAPTEPVDPDAEKYGGDLITAESNVSSTMDPHMGGGTTGNARWMNHVFETLAVMDADSTIYGEICDFEQSADGLTYTFTLRDRHFSNGKKITMEDIEASIRRVFRAFCRQATFLQIYAPLPFFLPVRSRIISPSGVLRTLIRVFLGKCSPHPVHLLVGILRTGEFSAIILRLYVNLAACKTGNKLGILTFLTNGKG